MYGFAAPTSAPYSVSACKSRISLSAAWMERQSSAILLQVDYRYAGRTIISEGRHCGRTTEPQATAPQQSNTATSSCDTCTVVPCVDPCLCSDPNLRMLRTPLLPLDEWQLTLRSPCEWHPSEPQQQSPAASRQRMARCSEARPRALQGASVPA